jgi:hypothetical protein
MSEFPIVPFQTTQESSQSLTDGSLDKNSSNPNAPEPLGSFEDKLVEYRKDVVNRPWSISPVSQDITANTEILCSLFKTVDTIELMKNDMTDADKMATEERKSGTWRIATRSGRMMSQSGN